MLSKACAIRFRYVYQGRSFVDNTAETKARTEAEAGAEAETETEIETNAVTNVRHCAHDYT